MFVKHSGGGCSSYDPLVRVKSKVQNGHCPYMKTYGISTRYSSPRHKHWPAGPAHFSDRRTSSGQYILSFTGPYGPPRFQIALARTMTNHSIFVFRAGARPTSRQYFCYSEKPAWRESGMSIKHTDVSDTSMRTSGTHPGIFLRKAHGMVSE